MSCRFPNDSNVGDDDDDDADDVDNGPLLLERTRSWIAPPPAASPSKQSIVGAVDVGTVLFVVGSGVATPSVV